MALTVTPTDEMKTLKVGEKIYEIVDDEARTDLNEVKADFLQSLIYDTASGSVAIFPDGADSMPCKSVVAQIVPVQSGSGDPSPDNVRPISGWDAVNVARCGKNLIDKSTAYFISSNIIFGGTASVIDGSLILHPGTYVLSVSERMTGLYAFTMSGNFATRYNATSLTFTLAEKTTVKLSLYKADATEADMEGYNYQLELGSTATAYEPYTGSTYSVSLPQTVYGGQVDVVSGEGRVTWGYIDSYNGGPLPGEWISDRDVYAPGTTPTIGAQVAYALDTPTDFEVTPQEVPTLYGSNTVYADSGDVEVEYPADTKLYISRLTEPDSADMIADANIVSGKYFMVGNDLYLATANIANGGAITPGTNCTKVSLATALNAINS